MCCLDENDLDIRHAAVGLYLFIFVQESDLEQADKYAELAMSADRYNPAGKEEIFLSVCLFVCLSVSLWERFNDIMLLLQL